MVPISVCVNVFNEEDKLPALFDSLKGIEDIVIYDHCSTDRTVEICKEHGARVFTHPLPHVVATQEDVDEFKNRFSFAPKFKAGDKIDRWVDELNSIIKEAKNDWILQVDADEIVTWNLDEIQQLMKECDAIGYTFVHERDGYGNPKMILPQNKLFNRTKFHWSSQVHAVLVADQATIKMCPNMIINHYQKSKMDRSKYIDRMEYAEIKDKDMRNTFYLAREYGYYGEYEKAIQFGLLYFSKNPIWRPEICEMWLIMSKCYWRLGKGEMARRSCMEAIMRNPNFREAHIVMSEITWENDGKAWRRFADQANNDDVLFINKAI